ncbi:hypothetical protein O3M35_005493 [Rhynocoris fuscipes]|uniref:Uncharacterized protein n=1 Tax=Rhynocoris fuscipes TaxID=488301 RepID=A0AAW1DIV3_9HEMI
MMFGKVIMFPVSIITTIMYLDVINSSIMQPSHYYYDYVDVLMESNIKIKREVEDEEKIEITEKETNSGEIDSMTEIETVTGKPMIPHYCRMSHKYHVPIHKTCCGESSILLEFNNLTDPSRRTIKFNCRRDIDDQFYDAFHEAGKMSEAEQCERHRDLDTKRHYCMHECIMKNKKMLLDEDGSVDFIVIRGEVERIWSEEEWKRRTLLKAVDICERYNYDTTWRDNPEELRCNPQSMELMNCLWKEIELNCPEEQKSSKRFCSKLRTRISMDKTRVQTLIEH